MSLINEKQFLEMSDIEKNAFIGHYVFDTPKDTYKWNYVDGWSGQGQGIEHANENGFYYRLEVYPENHECIWQVEDISYSGIKLYPDHAYNLDAAIKLAFWIAYMKALGVIE